MKSILLRIFLPSILPLFPLPAAAHDFWLEPATFTPAPRAALPVRLLVGERGIGEPLRRNSAIIEKFAAFGPSGEKAISGRDGCDPAGSVRLAEPGIYILGYRGKVSSIELEAEKFTAYLREEGLEKIIALREKSGQSGRSGRERYSRCAKAVLQAGDAKPEGFDRKLDFTLELVPEKNPGDLKPGDTLPVRLLYEGKPLEGARVVALQRPPGSREPVSRAARSDKEGRVELPLGNSGHWLIKCVHMVPAPEGSGADWESFWASLTFSIPGRAGSG